MAAPQNFPLFGDGEHVCGVQKLGVVIGRQHPGSGVVPAPVRLLGSYTLPLPLHAALDAVHSVLWQR